MIRLNEIELPLSVGAPAWLAMLRRNAFDRFAALGGNAFRIMFAGMAILSLCGLFFSSRMRRD
jgi:hypothetical protein